MMLEKRIIETVNEETKELEKKEIYIETTTYTVENEITIDSIDSRITQNNSNILSMQEENKSLEIKKKELLAL